MFNLYEKVPYQKIFEMLEISDISSQLGNGRPTKRSLKNEKKQLRVVWFIEEIFSRQLYWSSLDSDNYPVCEFDECNHFNFCSIERQRILGALNPTLILKALADLKVISTVRGYSYTDKYHKPYLYRFIDHPGPVIGKMRMRREFKNLKKSVKSLYELRVSPLKQAGLMPIAYQLAQLSFNITEDEFKEIVIKRYPKYEKNKIENNKDAKSLKDYLKIQQSQLNRIYEWNNESVSERISKHFRIDEFSGRLHTIFSTMMKEIRAYVVSGKDQIFFNEIDIVVSQLSFMANMMYKDGVRGEWINSVLHGETDPHTFTANKLGISRINAKKINYTILFCPVFSQHHQDFCKSFPAEGEFLTNLKKTKSKNLAEKYTYKYQHDKDGNMIQNKDGSFRKSSTIYKSASCEMQKVETELMKKVWKKLRKCKVHFLPVHDAVYVERSFAKEAERIVLDILNQDYYKFSITNKEISK